MATNDFQVFATGAGANVLTQSAYLGMAALTSGFESGIALSAQLNKVWRQSSIISSMVAQFIADQTGQNAADNYGAADGGRSVLEANFILAIQNVTRTKATANASFFVATNGSDANNGLATTTPFLTLQHAINVVTQNWDFNGFTVAINILAGTYATGGVVSFMPLGASSMSIQGASGTTAASVVIAPATNLNAITVQTPGLVQVSGLTVQSPVTGTLGGFGISSNRGATIQLTNVILGTCSNAQIGVGPASQVTAIGGVLTFQGTAPVGIEVLAAGAANISLGSVTFSGTPVYATAFVVANQGQVIANGITFTGTFTGVRYIASFNGVIFTNGAGTTYFPGTSAGSPGATSTSLVGIYD